MRVSKGGRQARGSVCECERVRVLDREEDDKTDEGERVEGGNRERRGRGE